MAYLLFVADEIVFANRDLTHCRINLNKKL